MKKHKKNFINPTQKENKSLFIPVVKSSRLTINSRICNVFKFNELFSILDNTKDYKNIISHYCHHNLTSLVSDYKNFLTYYKSFDSKDLNSWEIQTIFQEISGHYHDTAQRYLTKATYKVNSPKTNISTIAKFIDFHSNLNKVIISNTYELNFNIEDNLIQLKTYLNNYIINLAQAKLDLSSLINVNSTKEIEDINKQITGLDKKIKSYHKLMATYALIKSFSLNKPLFYLRIITLITTKKIRLLSKIKLGIYTTGTHARSFANGQISIVKDINNTKYNYFLKIRKFNKLLGREPKLSNKNKDNYPLLLDYYNDTNFIYLPLIFNGKRLKEIHKTIDNILNTDNPQILIKSEQLRINQSSRKIHLIFNYKESSNLGKVIENSLFHKDNDKSNIKKNISIGVTNANTIGVDVNLKNNLLADSNGVYYDQILTNNKTNKTNFINNINEIVLLQNKALSLRTEKENYRYNKLLRTNESLLKTYISGIIKDWKAKNILHIVMEDLNFVNDSSYYQHKEVKIKYTRLSRLLRLGQIKHWVASMGEKKGLFTHIVNPAYTSQECSLCHYISRNNRKKQEVFKCMNPECCHDDNADTNAASVIKSRITNVNIRNNLGKDNVYLCSRTKPIHYKLVKDIVHGEYKIGVITELFPDKHKILKSKKDSLILLQAEDQSFRAG